MTKLTKTDRTALLTAIQSADAISIMQQPIAVRIVFGDIAIRLRGNTAIPDEMLLEAAQYVTVGATARQPLSVDTFVDVVKILKANN